MKMRLMTIGVLAAFALGQAETNFPTLSPSAANTTTDSPSTPAPTTATNSSVSPSLSPSEASNSTQPTQAPTANDTVVPTSAPTNSSEPPSAQPSFHFTEPPTGAPTHSPSASPSKNASPPHKASIGKIIAKTLGWLILIALSVLLFGAAMSNRYQIYYALRGVWYTILQMQCTRTVVAKLNACTRWVMEKLNVRSRDGGGGAAASGSLNEIIFDNDLTEGLLMGDT